MPRLYDSDENPDAVVFVENVDCEVCGVVAECYFIADAETVYDLTDAPTGVHTCLACGASTEFTFSGWTLYTEAG